jgi:hypothetical protein
MAGDVFFHEATHAETAADDPDPQFRNYTTELLSLLSSTVLGESLLNGTDVAQGVTMNDVETMLQTLNNVGQCPIGSKEEIEKLSSAISNAMSEGITMEQVIGAIDNLRKKNRRR